MPNHLKKHWFLASLLVIFLFGFFTPHVFAGFSKATTIKNLIVATVLFVMALPLDTRSIAKTMGQPWPAFLAVAMNMLALPLLAWILSRALAGDMRQGLLVAAAVPCTLASAAVWTRRAGGDDTVAILVTAITNITCFLTTPFWLYWLTGSELDPSDLTKLMRMPIRLGLLVVLPMAIAQLLRQLTVVGNWAAKNKSKLSLYCQFGILSMVLAGATTCGLELQGTGAHSLRVIPLMCLMAAVLHIVVLVAGMWAAKALGFQRPQQIAVAIAGSQKTLMVGLDIAISYFGGLVIVPMVAYHFIQLVADTLIADKLNSSNTK